MSSPIVPTAGKHVFFARFAPLIDGKLVIIFGVARSGTTLLGQIVSTLQDVEYEYEPALLGHVPVLVREGLMDPGIARDLLHADLDENFVNHVLGRNANLRVTDDSLKTRAVPIDEIERRWRELRGRPDAEDFIARHRTLFVVKQVSLHPFVDYLLDTFKGVKLIHIIRNAFDVAMSISRKEWYSDAALTTVPSRDLRRAVEIGGAMRYVPWWIADDEARSFLAYSDYERSLYRWIKMMSAFMDVRTRRSLGPDRYLEVRYRDLLLHTKEVIDRIEGFVGKARTSCLDEAVGRILRTNGDKYAAHDLNGVSPANVERAAALMDALGYPRDTYWDRLRGLEGSGTQRDLQGQSTV